MSNPKNKLLENKRKTYAELYQGGNAEVRKRIKKWKEIGGAKPSVDYRTVGLQIKNMMIDIDETNINRLTVQKDIYKYLLDRSFECKLLEYELNKLAEKKR